MEESLEPTLVLSGRKGAIHAVTFICAELVACGYETGSIDVWSTETGKLLATGDTDGSGVFALHAFLGRHLLSQTRDGVLSQWDLQCERPHGALVAQIAMQHRINTGARSFCRCAPWLPEDAVDLEELRVATPVRSEEGQGGVSMSSEVSVWNWALAAIELQSSTEEKGPERGMCTELAMVPGAGRRLVTGFESGHIGMLDCEAGCWLWIHKAHEEPVMGLAITLRKGHLLGVTGAADKLIAAFVLHDQGCDEVGRLDKSHGGIGQLCVRGDQRVFASAGWDNRTRVFCLKTLTPVAILRHHRDSVNAVAFSSNNSSLASGSKDGKLCLWDVLPRISKSKLQPRKMADIAGL